MGPTHTNPRQMRSTTSGGTHSQPAPAGRRQPRRVILIGYMGSGKTTVGHALAQATGLPFYDLDWYIETRMHSTVKKIFDDKGEEGFRRIEHNMLHEVAEFEDVIISCGGGTPCFFDNIDYINAQGDSVYLRCSPDVLYQHLKMGKTVRPLLLGKTPGEVREFIGQQLAVREPYYAKARHTIDVTLMDNREQIKVTVDAIRKKLGI